MDPRDLFIVRSTTLGTFRDCPRKFYNAHVLELVPTEPRSPALAMGELFARGLEVARKALWIGGHPVEASISLGLKRLLTEPTLIEDRRRNLWTVSRALVDYWDRYASRDKVLVLGDDIPCIELTFSLDLPVTSPKGEPYVLQGSCDALVEVNGEVWILDEKTTAQLGPSWALQWPMRAQFTAYTWAVRNYGIPAKGVLVRGIRLGTNETEIVQVLVQQPEHHVKRWLDQTVRDLHRMNNCVRSGEWDYNLGSACFTYSRPCEYMKLCLFGEEAMRIYERRSHEREA